MTKKITILMLLKGKEFNKEKIIRLNLFLSQKNCDKIYNLSNGQFYIIDIDNNHNPDNLIF